MTLCSVADSTVTRAVTASTSAAGNTMIAIPDQLPNDPNGRMPGDPSPEEIARRAAAIRRRWSDFQRQRRRVTPEEKWVPPTVHIAEMEANLPPRQAS